MKEKSAGIKASLIEPRQGTIVARSCHLERPLSCKRWRVGAFAATAGRSCDRFWPRLGARRLSTGRRAVGVAKGRPTNCLVNMAEPRATGSCVSNRERRPPLPIFTSAK